MQDDVNAMMGPVPATLGPYVNAFRAGRTEAAAPPTASLAEQIAGLGPEARAAAAQRAEVLGAIGQGLAGRPYGERRALLAHMGPQLAARGVAPAAVADFDPTDGNLAAVMD